LLWRFAVAATPATAEAHVMVVCLEGCRPDSPLFFENELADYAFAILAASSTQPGSGWCLFEY
jgi:hypothetical protein